MSDDWGDTGWPETTATASATTAINDDDDDGWGGSSTTSTTNNQSSYGLESPKGTSHPNKRKLDDSFETRNDRSGYGRGLGRAQRMNDWRQTNHSVNDSPSWGDNTSNRSDNRSHERTDRSFNGNRYGSDPNRKIQIQSSFVGRVIGKGGQTIKDLQYKSGAKINVSRDNNSYETDIELIGTNDQMDCAERLINDLVGNTHNSYTTNSTANNSNRTEPKKESPPPEEEIFDWGAAIKESEEATKRKWAALPTVNKQFYFEHEEIRAMNPDLVDEFRLENNNIMVSHFNEGDTRVIPNPVQTFIQAFEHFRESSLVLIVY